MQPNAYVELDPKPILLMLSEYSLKKQMTCTYKKNAHRLKLEVPTGEASTVNFWVIFEKGRKKSTKGLYKLTFKIEEESKDESTVDQEFLCTGFLQLIKDFATTCGNPL